MTSQLELTAPADRMTSKILFVDPKTVRVSPLNPRADYPVTQESIAPLAAELKAVGQINDVHAEYAEDGVLEILAGARRTAACIAAGIELRVRVLTGLTREEAIKIAYRGDKEAVATSLWDLAGGWKNLLDERVVKTETALAALVGVDKSTLNRGIALRDAPEAILEAFADRREISQSQWAELAPLVADKETCAKLVVRAALIEGKKYAAPRVASEFKAAAADKVAIEAVEVRNRHDRVIATIHPGHKGDFTVKIKTMTELHPSYRVEHLKLVHDRLAAVVKEWSDRDA